jgi:hypothetical protein
VGQRTLFCFSSVPDIVNQVEGDEDVADEVLQDFLGRLAFELMPLPHDLPELVHLPVHVAVLPGESKLPEDIAVVT